MKTVAHLGTEDSATRCFFQGIGSASDFVGVAAGYCRAVPGDAGRLYGQHDLGGVAALGTRPSVRHRPGWNFWAACKV